MAVFDDLVRDPRRLEDESTVGAGAPIAAFVHDARVVNHVQSSFMQSFPEYTL